MQGHTAETCLPVPRKTTRTSPKPLGMASLRRPRRPQPSSDQPLSRTIEAKRSGACSFNRRHGVHSSHTLATEHIVLSHAPSNAHTVAEPVSTTTSRRSYAHDQRNRSTSPAQDDISHHGSILRAQAEHQLHEPWREADPLSLSAAPPRASRH